MKIAIFRALQLGDMLCAIPAIRTLKRSFPLAELYCIGLPNMRSLLERYDFVDHYVDFPGYEGLPEQHYDAERTERFVSDMQKQNFDLLLQMQGNGTIVNDFLSRWNAKRLVGFCPVASATNKNWMLYPKGIHEINRHLQLLTYIGILVSPEDRQINYPLFPIDWQHFAALKASLRIGRYAIVHVGSRSEDRQWPLANFSALAHHLMKRGLQIVLTGTTSEQQLTNQVEEMLEGEGEVINVTGRTDLGLLGCVVQQAEILVSNCTGISHIAAATGTRSLVLSMDGEPERWGPLNHRLHHTYNANAPLDLKMLYTDLDGLLASDG